MSDAKKSAPAPEAADAPAKPKKNTLLYIVIAALILVILVGGGVAAYLVLSLSNTQNYSEQQAAAEESDSHGEEKEHKKKKKKEKKGEHGSEAPVFVKLDTFTVNLQGGTSVLQTEVHVQIADEKQAEVIKGYMPRLSSQVNLILSAKKPEELVSVESKVKLMEEIKVAINRVLGAKDEEDGVMSVEFSKFIVQ